MKTQTDAWAFDAHVLDFKAYREECFESAEEQYLYPDAPPEDEFDYTGAMAREYCYEECNMSLVCEHECHCPLYAFIFWTKARKGSEVEEKAFKKLLKLEKKPWFKLNREKSAPLPVPGVWDYEHGAPAVPSI